jgi:3-dehydrotetronate 4-kinase
MRDHPLTPMTNPNLVELLGRQTKRRVGLASYREVEAGAEYLKRRFQELREGGVAIAIVDCLNDTHLQTICRAASDLRLITGSSAFGMKMPAIWRERGWVVEQPENHQAPSFAKSDDGCLIVAGSCSVATRGQNEWLAAQGAPVQKLNSRELVEDNFDREAVATKVRAGLAAGRHCLLTTTDTPEEVRQVQQWGAHKGLNVAALGELISSALADVVWEILQGQAVGGLIIAGGETSGALCRRLDLGALRVGRNIEPGVPLCFSLGRFRLPLVLKSGSFGARDFYDKALRAVTQPDEYLI